MCLCLLKIVEYLADSYSQCQYVEAREDINKCRYIARVGILVIVIFMMRDNDSNNTVLMLAILATKIRPKESKGRRRRR